MANNDDNEDITDLYEPADEKLGDEDEADVDKNEDDDDANDSYIEEIEN